MKMYLYLIWNILQFKKKIDSVRVYSLNLLVRFCLSQVNRDTLKNFDSLSVSFSMGQDQVPFTTLSLQFKTSEAAAVCFDQIFSFWQLSVDESKGIISSSWDDACVDDKTVKFHIIDQNPELAGTIHGRANSLLERIEKCLVKNTGEFQTTIQPGITHMPDYSFGCTGYINPVFFRILQETSKVEIQRHLLSQVEGNLACTVIRIQFQSEEGADEFQKKIAPYWKPYYDMMKINPSARNIVDFYTEEEDPHNPEIHGNALELASQIALYSKVAPVERAWMSRENSLIDLEQ